MENFNLTFGWVDKKEMTLRYLNDEFDLIDNKSDYDDYLDMINEMKLNDDNELNER
tara:strand:+ start:509 stop:676 length:168 start_codon:yes stop_codon:yes gene_type:complete